MTSGPKVRLGTNWPSITSHWMLSTPAFASAATSSPSRAKSAGSTEGTIWIGRATPRRLPVVLLALVLPAVVLCVPRLVARGDLLPPVLGGGLAGIRAEHVVGVPPFGRRHGHPSPPIEVPIVCLAAHDSTFSHVHALLGSDSGSAADHIVMLGLSKGYKGAFHATSRDT